MGTIHGIVQKVSLRATRLRTFDNSIIFVPNSAFMNASFVNWTHNGHRVRCTILVGVAYDSNLDKVKDIVLEVLRNDERVLQNPEPTILFMDFAASSLDFEVRFWIHDVLDRAQIKSEIRFLMKKAFNEFGIEVPFPQTDINMSPKTLEILSSAVHSETESATPNVYKPHAIGAQGSRKGQSRRARPRRGLSIKKV